MDWAGGLTGPGYATQGNILVSEATVAALASTFVATTGRPLAERLLECLAAAQAAGGDRRGQQSAALLVVEHDGGYAALSDVLVDLRVDDHATPVPSSRVSTRCIPSSSVRRRGRTGSTSTTTCASSSSTVCGRSATTRSSSARSGDWAGTENLEERIDGVERIDPVVLAELRAR